MIKLRAPCPNAMRSLLRRIRRSAAGRFRYSIYTQGVPYLIHHASPFQLCYEEDGLERYGRIIGHYRMKPACLDLLERA